MRSAMLILLVLVSLGLTAAQANDGAGAGIRFLDKGLDSFRYYLADHLVGMEDVWSIRDNVLICKGEPMGYLYTKKVYKDFRLHLEWRWAPGAKPGNSGVLMRINGKPMPLPRCLECQLQADNAGDLYGFHGMKLGGQAERLKSVKGHELGGDLVGVKKIEGNEKNPGEWNTLEVLADGPRLRVWVNGKLTNEATDADVVAGPIALQSEGGEIHFRNIVLKPLAKEDQ